MIKIYHNPRCKKSRAGLDYLKQKTTQFEVIKYLTDQPFNRETLADVLDKTQQPIDNFIRTQESIYKQSYKGKDLSREEWLEAMVANPKLIARPLVVKDQHAVLGDPPENIDTLF
ncbi:MAG: ArsC/Spx/MgsR family protein [Bacteroidota bacterium]